MGTEKHGAVTTNFVTTILPWMIGAAGLLIYVATLSPWASLINLGMLVRTSGWSWQPEVSQPLTFAVFYAFRLLPESMVPLVSNLFTAVCAATVLVLLARSVALLPHDLAPADPSRRHRPVSILSTPTAWMPPVLTAIVCGLQLSFWEHATSASGRMIDLLVFAYVVRGLLEYGVDRDERWLFRSAFAYAIGMADNWMMVACFPVFVIAVLRTLGLRRLLNLRLLARIALWGLAGLTLYLMQPLLQVLAHLEPLEFGRTLRLHVKQQMQSLAMLQAPGMRVLVLTSLLPLALISIRWKSHTAQLSDDTREGVFLMKWTGHLVHAIFFGVSLWIALDPAFGPRYQRLGTPMLTYYYISALVCGYCAGYFLLFESDAARRRHFSVPKWPRAAGWALVCVFPVALLWRNIGQITYTNGPALREFTAQLCADLPEGKSVVLSEDRGLLQLLQTGLSARRYHKDPVLLNTPFLFLAEYQVMLANRFGSRWPMSPPTNSPPVIRPNRARRLVTEFAAREPVVYLHPSSGFLVEPFDVEPAGLIHRLAPWPAGEPMPEPLGENVVAANERIWTERWTNGLQALAGRIREQTDDANPGRLGPLLEFLSLKKERNPTAAVLGAAYSKSLNYWGVQMQQRGRWNEAGVWFSRAVELNPDNLPARINLLYNERHRQGDDRRLESAAVELQFLALFSRYDDWREALTAGGPVDEPTFLLRTAQVLLPGGNHRQALGALARCSDLAPDWPAPRFWLARNLLWQGRYDKALAVTETIRTSVARLDGSELADLLYCRATALRGLGKTNEAAAVIEDSLGRHGERTEVLAAAVRYYEETRQFTRALDLLERLLKLDPHQPEWLTRKGLAQLALAQFNAAAITLTRALTAAPLNEQSRLYRAVAYLAADRLDAARGDYQQLLQKSDFRQRALLGLGELAWRERNVTNAIRFYDEYLGGANSNTVQYLIVAERLNRLKSGRLPASQQPAQSQAGELYGHPGQAGSLEPTLQATRISAPESDQAAPP